MKTMDVISVTGFLLERYVFKYIRHMLVLIITGISCTAIRILNYYHPLLQPLLGLKLHRKS